MLTEATRKTRTILPREKFSTGSSGGGESIPLFPFFSFRENFLTIFEKTGKERERERVIIFESFCGRLQMEEGGRVGGVGMDFRRLGVGYIVLSSYGNEIELERFCFYGCNLERLRVNGIDFTKRSPGIRDTRALSQDLRK